MQKLRVIQPDYAVMHQSDYIVFFGMNGDLYLGSGCNKPNSSGSICLGDSYECPVGVQRYSNECRAFFGGSTSGYFQVEDFDFYILSKKS